MPQELEGGQESGVQRKVEAWLEVCLHLQWLFGAEAFSLDILIWGRMSQATWG